MLYQMLPTVVTSRLPTLPSLRKSLNEVRNRGLHSKSSSLSVASEPTTPPPGYSTRPGSSSATPNHFSLGFTETEFDFSDDASEQSSLSGSAPVPMLGAHETATGINWKYASQGGFVHGRDLAASVLTEFRQESNHSGAARIEHASPRYRRDIGVPHATAIHTWHYLFVARIAAGADTRRDSESPCCSSNSFGGQGCYGGRVCLGTGEPASHESADYTISTRPNHTPTHHCRRHLSHLCYSTIPSTLYRTPHLVSLPV
ncbi:predicted protein [Plenodomus lingam JN3]|uniref:Predicted protein n=1 Tax=Leptosphaeria maculans (strain JN3 / isolate v23.1.3 / race Av1-4-5-6-7-8) TaxID=985895 RepID=E4ZJF6_LEPMJ|nr:predicted protein [Plenodomus lingam JN3]CBX91587.1 predicted protein [Plenodomus lingam JN3]